MCLDNLIKMRKVGKFINDIFRTVCNEFRLAMKDKGVLIFLFLVPLLYPVVYALIYNPELDRDVPVVVVDQSRSSKSRDLCRRIDASEAAMVAGYAADMEEAKRFMAEKKSYGIVLIDRDFDRNIGRGESGQVTLYCDMSLLIRYKSLLMALTESTMDLGSDIRVEEVSRLGAAAPSIPATVGSAYYPLGNPEQGFATFLLPGIVILVVQQTMLLAICMMGGAIYERRRMNGGIDPLDTVGSGTVARLFGKAAVYLILYVLQLFYLIYFVPAIFSYPQMGSLWEEFLMCLPYMLGVIFLGLTLQLLSRERETVFLLIVFTSVLLLFLSGVLWPTFGMNNFLQFLGGCFPSTWAMQAFVRMNANGATLSDVSHEYYMMWLLVVVYFLLAFVGNKVAEYKYRHCQKL